MMAEPTPDTKAVLMLTAPLLAKTPSSKELVKPLKPKEYRTLAAWLHDEGARPAELMERGNAKLIADFAAQEKLGGDDETPQRLRKLLERGVELAFALERWNQRAIWVLGHNDREYPERWKQRFGEDAFPLLYGCGDPGLLANGGLAVVGSRHAPDEALECAANAGRLAARADCTIVSGGARGSDQAAMRGALEEGGSAVGVLANGLDRAVLHADHLEVLRDEKLVLVCPWDPGVRFQVWRAMQRNKLIYALADAALVAAYEPGKGGTWSGATEQLKLPQSVPVYVRDPLMTKGAQPWREPQNPEALRNLLRPPRASAKDPPEAEAAPTREAQPARDSEEELFATVRRIFGRMSPEARTPKGLENELNIKPSQAKDWWNRLVGEKLPEVLERTPRPQSENEIARAAQLPASVQRLVRARLQDLERNGLLKKEGSRPVRYCLSEPDPGSGASGRMAEAADLPARGAGDRPLEPSFW